MDVRQHGDAHAESLAARPAAFGRDRVDPVSSLTTDGACGRPGSRGSARPVAPRFVTITSRCAGLAGRGCRDDRDVAAAEPATARRPAASSSPSRSPLPGDRAARLEEREASSTSSASDPTARARTAGQRSRWAGSAASSSARPAATWTRASSPVASTAASRKRAFLPIDSTSRARSAGRAAASGRPGIAAAAADVDEAPTPSRRSSARRRGCRATCRRATSTGSRIGGQVDRFVPGEEEPGVVLDRRPGGRRQVEPDSRRPSSRRRAAGGSGGKALNARRERITRTVQALLLSVVPVRAVRAPLPASFRRTMVVFRSSRAGPVRGRVSPCPSPVPLPE